MKLLILIMLMVFLPFGAHATKPYIQKYIDDANKIGEGRLSFMIWDVYDATLYVQGNEYSPDRPFALKLDYLLAIDGKKITKSSIDEIRKQGFDDEDILKQWYDTMSNLFPDVQKGSRIIGIRDENGHTSFYKNDVKMGMIDDPEFTKYFFNIWLGENTSKPELRRQLLGMK